MIIVEGQHSIHIAAPASLVTEDRELAWAEPFVIKNPAFAWVLGKFVGTGAANLNGHIFDAQELAVARSSVVHAPMNMLHSPHQIMGTYVANELVYPTGGGPESAAAEVHPYLEALAVFWKFYFPEAYRAVEAAHKQGTLAWSMECVPESVTCAGGCDQTFAYMGRQDPSYCDHLNKPAAPKRLNKPHFTAGALVIPPASPAWKNATVTELSTFVRQELEAASGVYEQTEAEFPHLDAAQWTSLMGELLIAAGNPFAKGGPAKKSAPKGPHAYAPRFPGSDKAPCKVCGKPGGDALHKKSAKDLLEEYLADQVRKADDPEVPKTDPKALLRVTPHIFMSAAATGPTSPNMPCDLCDAAASDPIHRAEANATLDPVLAAIAASAAFGADEGRN